MSKKYTPVKHKQEIIEATYQTAQYVAPIPPPNMLADYKKIDSTFADRIIKMAEEQNNASIYVNKTVVDKSFKAKNRGQLFSFIIVLLGFSLAAVFEILKDDSGAAITSLIVAVVPIAIATVKGMLKD